MDATVVPQPYVGGKMWPCARTSNSRPRTALSWAAGTICRRKRTGKEPTIVMAHGFSAVKEMYLDRFADAFAAAGLGALVFDNPQFSAPATASPDRKSTPWQQVSDYRDAITFCRKRCLRRTPARHRYLGLKLQRWSCDGSRGNRSTGKMCSGASPASPAVTTMLVA